MLRQVFETKNIINHNRGSLFIPRRRDKPPLKGIPAGKWAPRIIERNFRGNRPIRTRLCGIKTGRWNCFGYRPSLKQWSFDRWVYRFLSNSNVFNSDHEIDHFSSIEQTYHVIRSEAQPKANEVIHVPPQVSDLRYILQVSRGATS